MLCTIGNEDPVAACSASSKDDVDIEGPWKHVGHVDIVASLRVADMQGTLIFCISVIRTHPKEVMRQEPKGGQLAIAYHLELDSYRANVGGMNCRFLATE